MIEVELPDGTVVEFPDGTPQETMQAALQQKFGAPASPAREYGGGDALRSGLMQGMTFNFADEILAGAMTPIEMGIDAVQGKPFDVGRSYGQALERNRSTDAQMQAASPALATAGNVAGAVGSGVGLGRAGVSLMAGAKPTAASMAGRGLLEGAAYGGVSGFGAGEGLQDKAEQAAWGAGIGGALGGATGAVAGSLANRAAQAAVPSVDDLKSQAGSLYTAARQSGAVLPAQQSASMANSMRQIAANEGIITPLGRINDSYQKISALIRSFDDYGQGPLTVDQMQSVRRLIGNALKSGDGDERRIAMSMMEEFHRFLDPISPQIAQGNALYHRAMNADTLETLVDVARQKAAQYGRSIDSTLREQFGALERQIIKGEVRGFSPAEIEAISKVAQGGTLEGALSLISKAAPSGVVSAGMSGGVPFMIGNAVGGPVVGAAAAGGTMGAGLAARQGANAMTMNNAWLAATMSRSGGVPLPMPPVLPGVAQGMVAAEGTQAPRLPMPPLPFSTPIRR